MSHEDRFNLVQGSDMMFCFLYYSKSWRLGPCVCSESGLQERVSEVLEEVHTIRQ